MTEMCEGVVGPPASGDDCEEMASLTITVKWVPRESPVRDAIVEITGPSNAQKTVNAQGVAEFLDIPAGGYHVEARLDSGSPLVDWARTKIGSGDWAYRSARPPYPEGTNKCNLYVYEMANDVGYVVPRRERFSFRKFETVWYPPLAGHWADAQEAIGNWHMVNDPRPGDVISEAINYSDATGHVGIVSYPEPSGQSVELPPGQHATVVLFLGRRTVSAAALLVVENDWGFRSGQNPKFRRYQP